MVVPVEQLFRLSEERGESGLALKVMNWTKNLYVVAIHVYKCRYPCFVC